MDLKYDSDKITKIREKIEVIFGSASTWDDVTISERYNITGDGDLIMILGWLLTGDHALYRVLV